MAIKTSELTQLIAEQVTKDVAKKLIPKLRRVVREEIDRSMKDMIYEMVMKQQMPLGNNNVVEDNIAQFDEAAGLFDSDGQYLIGTSHYIDWYSCHAFDVDEDAQETLQLQAAWLKEYNDVTVTIEGHCDERGTREYNLALGEKRAKAAKNYLTILGVNASRVLTVSYGKEMPAVVGSNDDAWNQNRRSVTVIN